MPRVADRGVEEVIKRRIEPTDVDWLTSGTMAFPALELLQRAQRHLTTLHRVSETLAGARDLQTLAAAVLETILEVTAADRAALVLRRESPTPGAFDIAASRLRHPTDEGFTLSRTLVVETIAKGVSTFAHDASIDERFARGESVIGQRIRSVMCVPLRTTDEILGALYVDSLTGPDKFNEEDLELLAAIGNQAGVALHRVRLMGELERLLLDTVRAIAATIDAKDGYTHRHSERVATLASRIAAEMGLGGRPAGGRRALGAAARRRQDCRARLDSQQARPADARGVRRDAEASRARRAHPREHPEPAGDGGAAGRPVSPRTLGRHRLSRGPGRRRHSAARPPARRRGLLRRADLGARLPRAQVARRGRPPRGGRIRRSLRSAGCRRRRAPARPRRAQPRAARRSSDTRS